MNDFASAAMMKLVRDGLARQGIAPPPPTPARDGRVALGDKQALLARLWEQHGPGPVARIGEAIHGVQDDPTLRALVLAVDPPDLLARWQRLERFVHSRHRTRVEALGPARLRLQHVSLAAAPAPAPAEDLLVIGLLVALCERVLGQTVRARPLGGRHWLRQQGRWRDGPWPEAWHTWELRWNPAARSRSLVTDPVASDRWLEQLHACLRADPGRPWRVDELASACSHSARSLQRHLAQRQLCFSRMLTDVRVQCAAELLTTSALSVAEVGYHCGFADQPHFSRHFRQSTAVTPARYREQFSQGR
ncbi:MAG: helix-turn-helix transcriptional regulator [Hydrogenophaga sp.]|uniref:helix-turn-helix transcriptional regulator n=1 Tax=Hydrogenophaga sp. TaxID=1904254 RepID=UPI0025C5C3C4|nr:helix-turn-helix transcriptional regulator [Hydrogenophaga sp.]MBT9553028.1 helix-turn-helix transcriptional regulator [Hydrogenophaga sp.]